MANSGPSTYRSRKWQRASSLCWDNPLLRVEGAVRLREGNPDGQSHLLQALPMQADGQTELNAQRVVAGAVDQRVDQDHPPRIVEDDAVVLAVASERGVATICQLQLEVQAEGVQRLLRQGPGVGLVEEPVEALRRYAGQLTDLVRRLRRIPDRLPDTVGERGGAGAPGTRQGHGPVSGHT